MQLAGFNQNPPPQKVPNGQATDPPNLWTGVCQTPIAVTLRDRARYVDLTGLAHIRWVTRTSGFQVPRFGRMAALDGADAAVLVTEWPEFAELDWGEAAERMARPLLVDGRNFLDPEMLRSAGFEYEGIGTRRSSARPGGHCRLRCRRSSWSAARGRGCGR